MKFPTTPILSDDLEHKIWFAFLRKFINFFENENIRKTTKITTKVWYVCVYIYVSMYVCMYFPLLFILPSYCIYFKVATLFHTSLFCCYYTCISLLSSHSLYVFAAPDTLDFWRETRSRKHITHSKKNSILFFECFCSIQLIQTRLFRKTNCSLEIEKRYDFAGFVSMSSPDRGAMLPPLVERFGNIMSIQILVSTGMACTKLLQS